MKKPLCSALPYLTFITYQPQTLTVTGGSRSTSIMIQPPSTDTDGNGLPDLWETTFFGHTGVDPYADPDGDGVNNLHEFQNGTDPTDYYNGVLPEMTSLVGSDGALAPDNSISLKITNASGAPLGNAPATFRVKVGGHKLSTTAAGTPSDEVAVRTDATGTAKVYVLPGSN